ncbi:MAG: FAD-dependent oxidoreductase [Alphaproteobacteria bacterium]
MNDKCDLLVVGGGIAGLTAAYHGALQGLNVIGLEGNLYGGLVANVEAIAGYPAINSPSGTGLAMAVMEAAGAAGAKIRQETATSLLLAGSRKTVETEKGRIQAERVIIATGARLRTLGVPGESELAFKGVSQCATCDGGLFKGEDVVVVGGGDAALQEALVLTRYCRSITMVVRGPVRGRRAYVKQVSGNEKIGFRWGTTIEAILGTDQVEGVRLKIAAENRTEDLPCKGVFVFVGVEPATAWLPDSIVRDGSGALTVDEHLQTSAKGIYAVGAARAGYRGQIVNAASDGAVAAMAAAASMG